MLMIDVDNFKVYNDTYGHVAGDQVLKALAATLEACLKHTAALAARYGGEEFAVILPKASTDEVNKLAETIRSQVEALRIPHQNSPVGPYVTISIGGACLVPDTETTITALVEAADLLLYRAKHNGKNQFMMSTGSGTAPAA